MSFITYVLYNTNRDKIYIGYTSDLKSRLKRHNNTLPTKISSFTAKNSGKWKVVYKEDYPTKKEAMLREKQLKSSRGRNFIHSLLR